MSKVKTKKELLEEIQKYVPIFDEINSVSSRILKDNESRNSLKKISDNIDKWKKKLSNPKFEVAIIGLEKAGKSTMANALLNKNFLPEAKARCTFTTATIESDNDKDEAIVIFYSQEEFIARFDELSTKIKLGSLDFHSITLSDLAKLVKKKEYFQTPKELLDLKIMIENKEALLNYIGRDVEVITGDVQNKIKPYIVDKDRSMAVKSITIKSTELKDMKDIIIYDVPGFDSPTKLHLEQAKKYADEADVVIMMVSIAERVSFLDAQVEFLNQSSKDGVSLIDKTIVVASRWDGHIIPNDKIESENEINEYLNLLDNELKKFSIYREKNIFKVNPRAYLEKNGKMEKNLAMPKLDSINMDNGFVAFRQRLTEFFEYDALTALNDTVKKDINNINNFLIDFKREHNVASNEFKFESDRLKIRRNYQEARKKELIDKVIEYKDMIQSNGDFNINTNLEKEIHTNWIESLKITDDAREEMVKQISTDGVEMVGKFHSEMRELLYFQSIDLMTTIVSDTVMSKNEEIVKNFREDIRKIFAIDLSGDLNIELNKRLDDIMLEHFYDKQSYKPLIVRFINDIFKLLIAHPIATNIGGQRVKAFKNVSKNIESLLPFDKENYENEAELGLYEKTLIKKILVQYEEVSLKLIQDQLMSYKDHFSEKINMDNLAQEIKELNISPNRLSKILSNQKNKFKNLAKDGVIGLINSSKPKNDLELLVDYGNEATTYKEVQSEINKDLDNLKDIISNVILDAMMIQKPFLDSLNTQIEEIRRDLNGKGQNKLNDFMEIYLQVLDRDNYNAISGDPELNKKITNIISQIENL